MKLILLGTTGYHPNNVRQTACYMLPELGVVLDAGTGMFRVRKHLQTDSLDIFLTHAHLDHVVGLTYLFDVLHETRVARARVHGDAAKLTAVQEHLFSPELFPVQPPITWLPFESSELGLPRGGRLRMFPLRHPGGSLGFRLDWADRSLAYVTDTVAEDDADYVDEIRGVDLLLHECYFDDQQAERAELTGHSATSNVARVARRAGVGRLILVHINPLSEAADPIGIDVARSIFPATQIGSDHMEVEF